MTIDAEIAVVSLHRLASQFSLSCRQTSQFMELATQSEIIIIISLERGSHEGEGNRKATQVAARMDRFCLPSYLLLFQF